ncbi:MAG: VWA domain-containing protein, partial [Acidobacteria bacterium]|nr:VWA domain-containing protein [Acidobacteriota bacterium]
MSVRTWMAFWLVAATALAAGASMSAQGAQRQPQVPVFRSGVTLVPVDVRVLDKSGKPITDMKQEEFTILEDGVRQEIRHFSLQTLTPATPPADAKLTLREEAVSLMPQSYRIFLIVLGRGKLQEPSKGVDALISFVRSRLLPQDQLAVFAYDRATAFTTDHETVARFLERFKRLHEQVDFEIGLQMSGLAAVYGSKAIPRSLRGKIDDLFLGSGLLASQRVDALDANASRVEADARRQIEAQRQKELEVIKAEAAAAAGVPNLTAWTELDEINTQMFADLPLDEFVSATARTLQDLGNLYAGIAYLRNFDGEKHLVYVTERGLTLPRVEEDELLAAAANDARVAIDTIETGGIYVGQAGGEMPEGRWAQTFAFKTLRTIADLTGGSSSIAESGQTAVDRINDATRVTYLLGYYPSNARWNGTYRKVTVKVSRQDANVFYRHGYYGRKELAPFNRREFITADRIQAAAGFRREIKDIRLWVNASVGKAADGSGYEVTVDARIDPAKLAFTFVEGVHLGRIDIAVFCLDEKGNIIANSLQNADLKLTDDVFQRVVQSGIPYRVRMKV